MFKMNKHCRPQGLTFLKDQSLEIKNAYDDGDGTLGTTAIMAEKENVLNGSTINEVKEGASYNSQFDQNVSICDQ